MRKEHVIEVSTGFETSDIHDVYGFNRSIMSGMVWNKILVIK